MYIYIHTYIHINIYIYRHIPSGKFRLNITNFSGFTHLPTPIFERLTIPKSTGESFCPLSKCPFFGGMSNFWRDPYQIAGHQYSHTWWFIPRIVSGL